MSSTAGGAPDAPVIAGPAAPGRDAPASDGAVPSAAPVSGPPPSMGVTNDICPSCGVVRAMRASSCPHCHTAYPPESLKRAQPENEFWICIECTFKCRACGFHVPINYLDVDGGVRCARCGLEQAFDVDMWRDALKHSHGVAEMYNLQTPGRKKDVQRIGDRQTTVRQSFDGISAFEVLSSPGYPLCRKCHTPLEVTKGHQGEATAKCTTCDKETTYLVPDTAFKMMGGALKAALTADSVSEHAARNVQETPGAVALMCPTCSAPLTATSESKFLTCSYCKTVSRLPEHTWFQVSGKEPVPEPIWLLFHGSSAERRALEQKAENAAREQAEEAARRRAREHERRVEAQKSTAAADAEATFPSPVQKSPPLYAIALLSGFVIAAVTAGVAYATSHHGDADDGADTPRADAGRSHAASAAPPPLPPSIAVKSCTCSSQSAAGKDGFVLMAPSAAPQWSFDWTHAEGFVETESTLTLDGSGHTPVLPPANKTDKLRMGIACDGSVVAVILGNRATGWSGKATGALWSITLPQMYTEATPDAPPTGNVDAQCAAAIPATDGIITVALNGGKHVKISLKDGKLH